MDASVQRELDQLRRHHTSIGLMIGELEAAAQSCEGEDFLHAIEEITTKYNVPLI